MTANPPDSAPQDAVELAARKLIDRWRGEGVMYAGEEQAQSIVALVRQAVLDMQELINKRLDRETATECKLLDAKAEVTALRTEIAAHNVALGKAARLVVDRDAQVTALRTALKNLMAWIDAQNDWNSLTAPNEFVAAASALSATKEGEG